jgi:uncharacterized protein (TIGR02391 family)
MHLAVLIPDPDMLLALEPDELGVRMLPVLAAWPRGSQLKVQSFLGITVTPGAYPGADHSQIRDALREAWAWLEGAAFLLRSSAYVGAHEEKVLSRRALRIAKEADPRRALSGRKIPRDSLHSAIREDVWALFQRGKYATAVFEAMRAVEVFVRSAADLPDGALGVKLMRAAFAEKNGPLTDMSVEPGERVARMELFAGAIGSYKNPHSHRNVVLDDPDEAAEIIMLANHLLRIVEARLEAKAAPPPAMDVG